MQRKHLFNSVMTATSKKCLVWDLDNTLWDGTLLEDPIVNVKPHIADIIKQLDQRGILHSIASRNDHDLAFSKLQEFGLADYFLYPQINWEDKSTSIKTISEKLNLSLDSFAFIDDQAFEREEVLYALPEVLCLNANVVETLLDAPEFTPIFITEDSSKRRMMYQQDQVRTVIEESFTGPKEEFLVTLKMHLTISKATEDDLARAEELTVRTHQLNTTGITYDYQQLKHLLASPEHELLVAQLDDKFGDYGKIGLVLLQAVDDSWVVQLLLMSCRVLARGVGTVIITYLRQQAKLAKQQLRADFVTTDRNRMMYMTYKFNGFVDTTDPDHNQLINDLSLIPPLPEYLQVTVPSQLFCSG